MQHFLGDPDSGNVEPRSPQAALAIAKKTLDENRFKAAQKTMDFNTTILQNWRKSLLQEQTA